MYSVWISNSSIWPIDRTLTRCYYSESKLTWEQWLWRGTLLLPKLQNYWSFLSYPGHWFRNFTALQRCSRCILRLELSLMRMHLLARVKWQCFFFVGRGVILLEFKSEINSYSTWLTSVALDSITFVFNKPVRKVLNNVVSQPGII